MAKNRSIEQKKLKMKRRNRFARLSGAPSKSKERIGPTPFTEDEYGNTTTQETKRILVGPVSLSKQVMSTGRGPDAVRMQEYYQRIHSYDQALPETIGLSEHMKEMKRFELTKKYQEFIKGVPRELHINFLNDDNGRLDLFFSGTQFFWVEVNYRDRFWRRSAIYSSKKMAVTYLQQKSITWAEKI